MARVEVVPWSIAMTCCGSLMRVALAWGGFGARREARRDQVPPRGRCQVPRSGEAALEFGCVRPRTCSTIDSWFWEARPSYAVNKAPSKATRRMSGPAAAATPDDDPRTRSPFRWVVLILAAIG